MNATWIDQVKQRPMRPAVWVGTPIISHADGVARGGAPVAMRWVVRHDEEPPRILGRSLDADVLIDDPHAALRHAALVWDTERGWLLVDLGSVNGVVVDGMRVMQSVILAPGEHQVVIGRSSLLVRVQGVVDQASAFELPLSAASESLQAAVQAWPGSLSAVDHSNHPLQRWANRKTFLALLAVALAWFGLEQWLGYVGGRSIWPGVASSLLSIVVGAGVWVTLWALLGRVATGKPRWLLNATILLIVGLLLMVLGQLVDWGGFAWNVGVPTQVTWWMLALSATTLLYFHLCAATHLRRTRAAALALALPLATIGVAYWQSFGSGFARESALEVSMSQWPPSYRLREPMTVQQWLVGVPALRQEVMRALERSKDEDDSVGVDDIDLEMD